MKTKNESELQAELNQLIERAGGDLRASELIADECFGIAPDRSTIGKMRRGEGGLTFKALAVYALKNAIKDRNI